MNVRPIHNDDDHAQAMMEIERLWDAAPGTTEHEQLEVLGTLVNAYEDSRWPMKALDPVDAIKGHMDMAGYTQADLARLLGSRSRASEVLNCQRPLTMEMAWKLSTEWKIPAESLIKPYETKPKRVA